MNHLWTIEVSFQMEDILRNILKAQNLSLLKQISQQHNKDLEELKVKYWTPSFFSPGVDKIHVYPIEEIMPKVRARSRKSSTKPPSDLPNPSK